MVYYFSLAGDQERINCLRPEDEIADLQIGRAHV